MAMQWATLSILALCLAGAYGDTLYGNKLTIPKVSNAYVRTYVNLPKKSGAPTSVGLEITSAFLSNLNKLSLQSIFIEPLNFTVKSYNSWLDVPRQDAQPFKRVMFNWEASGHPTMGVYTTPHFDMHFTFNDAAAWGAQFDYTNKTLGPCGGASPAIFAKTFEPIPAQCFPNKTHTQIGDFVYGHGAHLFPLGAPEFNPPRLFNQTLIYGSWAGEVQFIEPMASYAYLTSTKLKSSTKGDWYPTIAPNFYKTARYYPTSYGYYWNKAKTTLYVELKSFKMSKVCKYSSKLGYAAWFPSTAIVPGPPTICVPPKPSTWKP